MAALNDTVYLSLFGVLLAILLYKGRQLKARWGNLRLLAVCAVLIAYCGMLWFAAPVNILRVSSLIGVANSGLPVLFSLMTVSSGSYLAVALLWRYPARVAWRKLRWVFAAYVFIIIAIWVLFVMSDTPKERPTDWGYYYIEQPSVAAISILWILPQLAGGTALAIWCFAWSKEEAYRELPWLRRGLRFYGGFGLCMAAFSLGLLIPVIASLLSVHELNAFGVLVPPLVAPIAVLCLLAALTVPVWGPRLEVGFAWIGRWRDFFMLRHLHTVVVATMPDVVMVATGKRFNPYHRVRRMLLELNDALLVLTPRFDPAVGEWTERAGRQAGLEGEELAATIETAQLVVASQTWCRDTDMETLVDTPADRRDESVRDGGGVQTELIWWRRIARAFKSSPVVAAALTQAPRHDSNPVNS